MILARKGVERCHWWAALERGGAWEMGAGALGSPWLRCGCSADACRPRFTVQPLGGAACRCKSNPRPLQARRPMPSLTPSAARPQARAPAPSYPTPSTRPLLPCAPLPRFFYANGDNCSTLYCRSGLRGSNSTGFPALPVYRAFRGLMQVCRRRDAAGCGPAASVIACRGAVAKGARRARQAGGRAPYVCRPARPIRPAARPRPHPRHPPPPPPPPHSPRRRSWRATPRSWACYLNRSRRTRTRWATAPRAGSRTSSRGGAFAYTVAPHARPPLARRRAAPGARGAVPFLSPAAHPPAHPTPAAGPSPWARAPQLPSPPRSAAI